MTIFRTLRLSIIGFAGGFVALVAAETRPLDWRLLVALGLLIIIYVLDMIPALPFFRQE